MNKKRLLLVVSAIILLLFLLTSCSFLGGETDKPSGGSGKKVDFTKEMIVRDPTATSGTFVYSGSEIKYVESDFSFEVNGKYPSYKDFDFNYDNNVNVGEKTAKLTITAKDSNPYCKGSVVLYFSIEPASKEASDKTELVTLLADPNYGALSVASEITVGEAETLTVPAQKSLRLTGGANLVNDGTLVIEGSLIVDGSTYYNGGTRNGTFKNNGELLNNGDLTVTALGIVINTGSYLSEKEAQNDGTIYTNSVSIAQKGNGAQYVRRRLQADDVILRFVDGEEYSQERGGVFPTVSTAIDSSFTLTYANNEDVGEATVTVTMAEKDHTYFGAATKTFTVLPGVATVGDYASLRAAHETGRFDRYEITGNIIVPEGEVFTVGSAETINFAGNKLNVCGTLTNNGVIKSCKTSYNAYTSETTVTEYAFEFTVAEGGSYGGTGKLSAEKTTVSASGDFTLDSPVTTTFVSFRQVKGTLNVKSALTTPSLRVDGEAALETSQTGNILCEALSFSGAMNNAGTIAVSGESIFYNNRLLENSGSIAFGAETEFYDLNMDNGGTIVNGGDLFCNKVTSFVSHEGGFDNTDGHVWTYTALEYLSENVTLKKMLSDEIFSLEYDEVLYDGTEKKPGFTLEGSVPDAANYTLSYSAASPKNAGVYTVNVRFTNKKCNYGGNYSATFEIKKATIEVDDRTTLKNVMKNTNYEKIVLTHDIEYVSSYNYIETIYLYEGITLDTNGYAFTLDRTNFNVTGKIIVRNAFGKIGLKFISYDKDTAVYLRNYGVIENEGIVCLTSLSTHYEYNKDSTKPAGTFLNNGELYCGAALISNVPVTSESTGNKYERALLSYIGADFALSFTETTFDNTEKAPLVSYVGSNAAVSASFNYFETAYINNRYAGTAAAIVTPDLLNPYYFGSLELPFTIKRAVKLVESNFLYQSDFNDPSNYCEVKLTQSTTLSATVEVPDDMDVNLSYYRLGFDGSAKLILGENSTLIAEANDSNSFRQNLNSVQKIIVTDDISDRIVLSFNSSCDSGFQRKNGGSSVNPLTVYALSVDLCGHDLENGVVFTNNRRQHYAPYFTVTFENSLHETTTSRIGDPTSEDYGFYQESTNADTRFVFNNVTIAGIRMDGDTSGDKTIIEANDCAIERSRTKSGSTDKSFYALYVNGTMNADTVFNGCTFSANDVNFAYVRSGEHAWNNCNLYAGNIYYGPFDNHAPNIRIDGSLIQNAQ